MRTAARFGIAATVVVGLVLATTYGLVALFDSTRLYDHVVTRYSAMWLAFLLMTYLMKRSLEAIYGKTPRRTES